jgi:two-component system LytT family response regulator
VALRDLLLADDRMELVGEARNGREALRMIAASPPEVLFLDIRMPGMDGFAVVDALRTTLPAPDLPEIIFVTAFDAFALRAFDAHALDYLLKPTDETRLGRAIDRVIGRLGERRTAARARRALAAVSAAQGELAGTAPSPAAGGRAHLERIAVTAGNRILLVKTEEIDWIEARSFYARLHVGARSYLLRESMHALEAQLDPRRFARIHRSTIVNIDRIASVEPYDRRAMQVVLKDGRRLTLSRRRRRTLGFLCP